MRVLFAELMRQYKQKKHSRKGLLGTLLRVTCRVAEDHAFPDGFQGISQPVGGPTGMLGDHVLVTKHRITHVDVVRIVLHEVYLADRGPQIYGFLIIYA
jgi:hypothetical protein